MSVSITDVVIVNDFAFVNGGAAQIAIDTARILADHGHRVTFFAAVGPVDDSLSRSPNINVVCLNQCDILHDPSRLRAIRQGIWNSVAAQRFAAVLKTMDKSSTIIHIHALQKALSASIIQVAHRLGFRTVYHLHDYGAVCPNLGLYNYQENHSCTLRPMSLACMYMNCDRRSFAHKLWRVARQWVQRHVCGLPRYIDTAIYISDFSLDRMRPYIPTSTRLAYLKNIVEMPRLPRITAEKNKYFVFIGRLSVEKGAELLAQATYELDLPVMFIGAGECEARIRELNPNAIMRGWLAKSEIHTTLMEARAVVFPSRWYETQGLVIPESMAQGIPCLVSHNTAASDMVADGETGLLFRTNDIADLKRALLACADDSLVARLSQNSYADFWREPYTADDYYEALWDIYVATLAG